ncbi:MAG: hypothetical protein AABW67_00780 [Nanoarchaeota archaeon]
MEEKQTKPYKSIEERIFIDTHIYKIAKDILDYGIKSFYGAFASTFRIPTLIRKLNNHQTFTKREEKNLNDSISKSAGVALGGFAGAAIGLDCLILSGYQAYSQENYIPLAIFGATNILSGLYELGRLSKSKQELLDDSTR